MTQPLLTGQDIGRAHFATRALLARQLGALPFPAWTALNLVGRAGAPLPVGELVTALVAGLKIDRAEAAGVVATLVDRGLVRTTAGAAEPTPAGREEFERVTAAIGHIVDVLYGDIPAADQLVARRVLELVKDRADAELDRVG